MERRKDIDGNNSMPSADEIRRMRAGNQPLRQEGTYEAPADSVLSEQEISDGKKGLNQARAALDRIYKQQ